MPSVCPIRPIAATGELLATMEADDAGALVPFEMAGVHDSLGLEADAVPLYREALSAGLDASHVAQARVQLASTLRNVGRLDEAIDGIVPSLTRYRRSLAAYAVSLTAGSTE